MQYIWNLQKTLWLPKQKVAENVLNQTQYNGTQNVSEAETTTTISGTKLLKLL